METPERPVELPAEPDDYTAAEPDHDDSVLAERDPATDGEVD
jgi:hypothetical protein